MRLTHHSNFLRAIQSLLLLLLLACCSAQASITTSGNCDAVNPAALKVLAPTEWQEVPISKVYIAKQLLAGNPFERVDEINASILLNQEVSTRKKETYLIQARYTNAGIGRFTVRSDGKSVLIQFDAIGPITHADRDTYMLLTLPRAPQCVMISMQGSE
ncbi:hypothetical protein [Leeia sp.]|uniref:hypothetical protein n=1 Tax=Leeia sp. TaxID=2884678 RepID=UPI0035B028C0